MEALQCGGGPSAACNTPGYTAIAHGLEAWDSPIEGLRIINSDNVKQAWAIIVKHFRFRI